METYTQKRNDLKQQVTKHLAGNKTFSQPMIEKCIDRFFGLDLEWTYVKTFSAEDVSRHVLGYLVATAEAEAGKRFEYAFEGKTKSFWFCEYDYESQLRTQRRIERYILTNMDSQVGLSFRSYSSGGGNVVLYYLELEEFPNPKGKLTDPLEKLATASFMTSRSDASKARYSDILSRLSTSIVPVFTVREVGDDLNITMGFLPDRSSYLTALTTLFNQIPDVKITKRFATTFSGGQQVYSFFIRGATKVQLEKVAMLIGMLPHRPDNTVTQLYNDNKISPVEVTYCHSIIIFAFYFTAPPQTAEFEALSAYLNKDEGQMKKLKSLRQSLHQEIMSEEYISGILEKHITFVKELYNDFEKGTTPESIKALYAKADAVNSKTERSILNTFVRFNESCVKTNFYKDKRAAVAYRLDPKVFMKGLDFPTMPYGVFLIVGAQFRGFHVRFNDIARGGIRMILSEGEKYRSNRLTLFQENYNLAHAQLLKNKDIPESGSKGTILVSPRRGPNPKVMFLQYIDAMLDVLLPGEPNVRDNLGQREILFMGPDENTAGSFPSDAAYHAQARGYKQWKSFTTGKGQNIGGIPHDIYGMTTESVRANVQAIYREHNLDETKLTKFQTGGPDGDLGSNEILLSKEKYIGLVDISGVLYDPEGVNRDELVRLANQRPDLKLKDFDTSKLSPKGFFVGAKETHRTLPDGTHVESGERFRDEFHFSNYMQTDVFVPCGGRPNAVTLENVHRMLVDCPDFTGDTMRYGKVGDLASKGKTRYKYIVEGANLFITQEARLALENVGVVIVKDSSANKGGVTSSSIEVLTALSLSEEEHAANMCVKDGKFPDFYQNMVKEIVQRIRYNATREFEAISVEVAKGKFDRHRSEIADELSRRIVKMRSQIMASEMYEDERFRRFVLTKYVPTLIQKLVGIDNVIARVPENYLRSCFATWLASDYVYNTGLDATEFHFFQYMHKLYQEAASQ